MNNRTEDECAFQEYIHILHGPSRPRGCHIHTLFLKMRFY